MALDDTEWFWPKTHDPGLTTCPQRLNRSPAIALANSVELATDTAGVEHRGSYFGDPAAVEHHLEYDQE